MRDGPFTCGNCEFAEARATEAALLAQAARAGQPTPPLHCRRFPAPLPKHPHEGCGEHSELIAERGRDIAAAIARALLPVRSAPPQSGEGQ
jgi:hypothetical protein